MLKKLLVGGIISMFMVVATVPALASASCLTTSCGTKSCTTASCKANISQIIKNCSKSNPQLAQLLSQIKSKKCNNTKNIQALLQKCLGCNSSNLVKGCSTTNNCTTIRCSNGNCYTINCSTGKCSIGNYLTGSCPSGNCK